MTVTNWHKADQEKPETGRKCLIFCKFPVTIQDREVIERLDIALGNVSARIDEHLTIWGEGDANTFLYINVHPHWAVDLFDLENSLKTVIRSAGISL